MNRNRSTQAYVSLVFFVMFIYGINNQAVGTLITRIIAHYNIRMAQAGLLPSFASAGNFAAIFAVTVFAGRVNKTILMGASLFFWAVSLYLISTAPPFAVILACFALIGIFAATTDTLVNSLVADLMPDHVSRSLSILHGIFGVGGLCGPIVIERLAENMSWEQVFFIIGTAFVIYLIIYVAVLKWQWKALAASIPSEKREKFGFSDIAQFFTQKRHVLLWITMFFYGGNQSTLSVWIKRYVETHLDNPAWGAYALSAMWLGTAVCRLFISPNVRASSPVKICAGNLISAAALAAGLLSGSAVWMTAASLVTGLSSGLTIPLILATGCEWHPDKTAYGTLMPFTALFISFVVFPPLGGLVGDFAGIPWGVAVGAASALVTSVFAGILNANLKQA